MYCTVCGSPGFGVRVVLLYEGEGGVGTGGGVEAVGEGVDVVGWRHDGGARVLSW